MEHKFRLSLPRMNATVKRSTHVRATCNFSTEELKYEDYLRAKLSDVDLMRSSLGTCKKFEFISVRRNNCTNDTAHFIPGIFGMPIVIRISEDIPVLAYPKVH